MGHDNGPNINAAIIASCDNLHACGTVYTPFEPNLFPVASPIVAVRGRGTAIARRCRSDRRRAEYHRALGVAVGWGTWRNHASTQPGREAAGTGPLAAIEWRRQRKHNGGDDRHGCLTIRETG